MNKWNEENICKEILKVKNILMLTRMPSLSEIKSVTKDDALKNAIRRNGGQYYFAKLLDLEMKFSETEFGIKFQDYCINYINKLGYNAKPTNQNSAYDIVVNDNIKIDVKCCCLYYNKGFKTYTFGINKIYPSCDLYILYALSEDGKNILKTFVIPSKYLKLCSSMSIGEKSKYDKYIDNWDYLKVYNNFYKSI